MITYSEEFMGLFLPPPPPQKKIFRKEMDNISVIFLCTFSKKYLLSLSYSYLKFDLKILTSAVTTKCWRLQRAVFADTHSFTPRNDRCNLSCSFLKLLILTMYNSFEDNL